VTVLRGRTRQQATGEHTQNIRPRVAGVISSAQQAAASNGGEARALQAESNTKRRRGGVGYCPASDRPCSSLRGLITELENLGREIADADSRWDR
jgi:hypothetical protein